MNNSLQVFSKDNFLARTIQDNDGNIWFVAKDVAQVLEYSESTINNAINSLMQTVPEIWKGKKRIFVRSENGVEQEREVLCLSEQGLYFFLGRSDKPKALPYQMWIAGEVVPSIMRTGFYATPSKAEEILNDPDTFILMLQKYKEQKARAAELEAQIEHDRPKVIFANSVSASDKSILVRDLAKLLRQNGYHTGERRLFAELRKRGFIMKKDYANMPTQKSMEMGLMEVLERTINRGDGNTIVKTTTKITGKGQIYFINLFLNSHETR